MLEFFKIHQYRHKLNQIIECENPEYFESLCKEHGSLIFVAGHIANWELPFLYFSQSHETLGVASSLKNPYVHKWVLSLRQNNKGRIISPNGAVKNCIRALYEGSHVALIFDQAYPNSGFSHSLLGTKAWTTLGPSIISYRSKKPVVFVSIKRHRTGRYSFRFHKPIYPNLEKPLTQEAPLLMEKLMEKLQQEIKQCPEQWLWQHNRWKQMGVNHLPKKFRHSFLLVVLPDEKFFESLKAFEQLYTLYTGCFFKVYYPKNHEHIQLPEFKNCQYLSYSNEKDCLQRDWDIQLVFDFTNSQKIKRHYLGLAAFGVIHYSNLVHLARAKGCHSKELHKLITPALTR